MNRTLTSAVGLIVAVVMWVLKWATAGFGFAIGLYVAKRFLNI